jgi:hypothetical protein
MANQSYGFGYSDSVLETESHIKDNTGIKIDFEQIFAGKSTFTLLSLKTNSRMTFKFVRKLPLRDLTQGPKYWVYVKITDPVTLGSSFKYIGFIYGYKGIYSAKNPVMLWDVSPELFQHSYESGNFKDVKYPNLGFVWDKDLVGTESELKFLNKAIDSIRYICRYSFSIESGLADDILEIHHSNSCCLCGKELTTPESIKTGIGPKCSKEVKARTEKAKSKPVTLNSGHVCLPHHS